MKTIEELASVYEALGSPLRLYIIGLLAENRRYVSELARELGISRPLLYMHLKKLEGVGIVKGYSELSGARAVKYYELDHTELVNVEKIKEATKNESEKIGEAIGDKERGERKEN